MYFHSREDDARFQILHNWRNVPKDEEVPHPSVVINATHSSSYPGYISTLLASTSFNYSHNGLQVPSLPMRSPISRGNDIKYLRH